LSKNQVSLLKTNKINWTLSDLLKSATIICLLLLIFVFVTRQINITSFLELQTYKSLTILGLILVQNLIFLLPIYLLVLKPKKITLANLGFRKVKISKMLGYTVLGFVLYLSTAFIIAFIQNYFNIEIPGFGQQIQKIPAFGSGLINMIIASITIIIVAPIAEEIIFRGFLYQLIAKYFPAKLAIPLAGFIFAVSHLEFNVILPLWLLGTIIAYIFHKTNSIYTTVLFHALNNLLAFIAEYFIITGASS